MIIQPIDKDIIDIANRRIFWKAGDNITQHITITAETDPRIVSVYEKLVTLQEIKDKLGDIALVSDRMLSVEAVAQNIDNLKALLTLDLQEFNSKLEDAVAKATEASENVKVYGADIEALKAKDTELTETIDTKKNEVVELINAVDTKLQTEYATLVKLAEKLTKSEADVYYEAKGHSYSKEESDEKYLKKSDSVAVDAYTKQESDDKFEVKDNGYSKIASDERYAHKQDVASTYATKEELAQAQLGGGSGGSVDLSSYETKAHAEATYAAKTDLELKVNTTTYNAKMSSVDSKIKTLEDTVPTLAIKSELEPLATKSELTPLLSKAVADTLYAPIGSTGNIDTSDLIHRGEYNNSIQAIYQELSNKPSLNDAAKSWTSTYSSEKIEQAYEGMYAKIEGEINKASSVRAAANKLVKMDEAGKINVNAIRVNNVPYQYSFNSNHQTIAIFNAGKDLECISLHEVLVSLKNEDIKPIYELSDTASEHDEFIPVDFKEIKINEFSRQGTFWFSAGVTLNPDNYSFTNAPVSDLNTKTFSVQIKRIHSKQYKLIFTLFGVSEHRVWEYYYDKDRDKFTDFVEVKYGSDGVKINDNAVTGDSTYSSSKIDSTFAKKSNVLSKEYALIKPSMIDIAEFSSVNNFEENNSVPFNQQYMSYLSKFFNLNSAIEIPLFGKAMTAGDSLFNYISQNEKLHNLIGGMVLSSLIQTPPIKIGDNYTQIPCNITDRVINLCNGYTFVGTYESIRNVQASGADLTFTFSGVSSPMNAFKSGLICLILNNPLSVKFIPSTSSVSANENYSIQYGSEDQINDNSPSIADNIFLYTYFVIPGLRENNKAIIVLNKLNFPQEAFRA